MMSDTTPLARQWRLLQTLSARRLGATVRELSDEMGVVDKTIRRDLQFLARVGFPLVEIVGEYGRKSWRLDFPPGVPPLSFTLSCPHTRGGEPEWRAVMTSQGVGCPHMGGNWSQGRHGAQPRAE